MPAAFPVTRENTGSSAQRPEHPSANRARGPSLPLRGSLRLSPKAIAIFLPAWLCSPILIWRFWPQTQHTVNAKQEYQCKLERCLKPKACSVHSISPRPANLGHKAIAKQRKWRPASLLAAISYWTSLVRISVAIRFALRSPAQGAPTTNPAS